MKKAVFFIIYIYITTNLFAQTKFIDIYVHFTSECSDKEVHGLISEYQRKLKEVTPFCEYADKIRLLGKKLNAPIITVDKYDQPIYSRDNIRRNHPIGSALDIYIVSDCRNFAKGGRVADMPVIIISPDATAFELLHETCHALANLGDEYDTGIDMTFSERYVSKYPNLTLAYPVPEWEKIKKSSGDEKIGYYPGGLGSKSGIYHSYPTCIMIMPSDPPCPICEYYLRKALSNLLK